MYSVLNFVGNISETDKNLIIYNINKEVKWIVNPFTIRNLIRNNNLIRISLNSGKNIILNFSSSNEASEAIVKLQTNIDTLKNTIPQYIDKLISQYLESIGSTVIGVDLDSKYLSGVKNKILGGEVLTIPEDYEYNLFNIDIDGDLNIDGYLNLFSGNNINSSDNEIKNYNPYILYEGADFNFSLIPSPFSTGGSPMNTTFILNFDGLGYPEMIRTIIIPSENTITDILNSSKLEILEDLGTTQCFRLINCNISNSTLNKFLSELPPTNKTATINISNNTGSSGVNATLGTSKGYIVII